MRYLPHRVILFSAYLLTVGLLVYLAWRGWSYYGTPLLERPRHPDYWLLKPGGSLGHTLGVVGASLMTIMHAYSLRKRWSFLGRAGRLSAWLDFHIFCGMIGPLFIVLHSSLKVKGLVSVSFWSMVAVVLSGFLGRFLYVQVPRRRSGDQLSLAEVETVAATQVAELKEVYGLSDDDLQNLDDLAAMGTSTAGSLLGIFWRLPLDQIRLRLRLRGFWKRLGRIPGKSVGNLHSLTLERAQLRQRIEVLSRLQELFHYWHVFHKPFAIIMYIFMVVHIGVAIATGYGWAPQ
jgi:putative flippase GtrA